MKKFEYLNILFIVITIILIPVLKPNPYDFISFISLFGFIIHDLKSNNWKIGNIKFKTKNVLVIGYWLISITNFIIKILFI
jgi:hypothetical protein